MSVAAKIKFVQGINAPPADQALDGVLAALVTASNNNDTDVRVWVWRMIDVPAGSAIPVGVVGNAPSYGFTPDVKGGYLLELTVYDVNGISSKTNLAVIVKDAYSRRIPPFSAEARALNVNGQARGWASFMEPYLNLLDRIRDWGPAAPNNGDVPVWVAANARYEPSAGGGGGGITQLTGDVLAGPGAGSVASVVDRITGTAGVTKVLAGLLLGWSAVTYPTTGMLRTPYEASVTSVLRGMSAPAKEAAIIRQEDQFLYLGDDDGVNGWTNTIVYGKSQVTLSGTGTGTVLSGPTHLTLDALTYVYKKATTAAASWVDNYNAAVTSVATQFNAVTRILTETAHGRTSFGGTGDFTASLGPLVGSETTWAAFWMLPNATALTSSNYVLTASATSMYLNAPSTGFGVSFAGGSAVYNFDNTGLIQFISTATPQINQATHATTPHTFTIQAGDVTTGVGSTLALRGGHGSASDGPVQLLNVTNTPATPTGGPGLFGQAGAAKVIGTSGTITTFGPAEPHCPQCGADFMTEHTNPKYGYLAICLKCLADEVGDRPFIIRRKAA